MQDIIDTLAEMRSARRPFAVATVVEIVGSVSAKTGAKAVINDSGRVVAGWVGGGCAESTVCGTALECMRDGETRIVELDLNDEVLGTGMPCGGSMRVYVEPILPKPGLWILGHGRVAECVCHLGALMGFRVIVVDNLVDRRSYPDADALITDDMDYSALQPTEDDYVVVATQHKGDHESMKRALALKAGCIALIASKKRSRLVMNFLRAEGFGQEDLARVSAPAGLDLGCRTPEEIALSVIGEIVMRRRGAHGGLMRDKLKPEGEAVAKVA
jgi:xanthine dehydrogenase accessory factor